MEPKSKQEHCCKQPYKKPVLRVVELATQEVLAVGCKLHSGGSAVRGTPPCASSPQCALAGSS